MATIYRFIVEEGVSRRSGGRISGESSRRQTAKTVSLLNMVGHGRGGVEINRRLRAINPLLNRATGGVWSRGLRIGRASLGLLRFKQVEGGGYAFAGFNGTAVAIISAITLRLLMRYHDKLIKETEMTNKQNFKRMENGIGAVHGNYKVSVNTFNGKISYNENR